MQIVEYILSVVLTGTLKSIFLGIFCLGFIALFVTFIYNLFTGVFKAKKELSNIENRTYIPEYKPIQSEFEPIVKKASVEKIQVQKNVIENHQEDRQEEKRKEQPLPKNEAQKDEWFSYTENLDLSYAKKDDEGMSRTTLLD